MWHHLLTKLTASQLQASDKLHLQGWSYRRSLSKHQSESWIIEIPPRSNCKWSFTQTIKQHNNTCMEYIRLTQKDGWIRWWKDGRMKKWKREGHLLWPTLWEPTISYLQRAHFCKLVSAKTLESMQPWCGHDRDLKCNRSPNLHKPWPIDPPKSIFIYESLKQNTELKSWGDYYCKVDRT